MHPVHQSRQDGSVDRRLRLDGTGKDFVRLTRFNDYEGWKASNPVISTDGKLMAVAQLRPKNLIPLAHVEHGAVFGDSLTLFGDGSSSVVQRLQL